MTSPIPRPLHWLLFFFASGIGGSVDVATAQTYTSARIADGFDYPVGKPDAKGYYKYRGFSAYGHAGEDWNRKGGGDSDLGAPIYSIAHGVVVYSDYYGGGYGQSVIVRHAYREKNGQIAFVDSLYTHMKDRLVKNRQQITRGQLLGTIGKGPGGIYDAHLHFELRKNLRVGMRSKLFPLTLATYHKPELFIKTFRRLRHESRFVKVPTNTFMKSNPNRVTSELLDLTEALPPKEGKVQPVVPTWLEEVIDDETQPNEASPTSTRAVFQKLFGVSIGE